MVGWLSSRYNISNKTIKNRILFILSTTLIDLLKNNLRISPQRDPASKSAVPKRGEYNVYSTFQSHEPEFDYLKSLEIEEKINKIRWLRRKNQSHFLLSTNDKTIKLWKVSERDKKIEGYNTKVRILFLLI